jgi:hypothetical protein
VDRLDWRVGAMGIFWRLVTREERLRLRPRKTSERRMSDPLELVSCGPTRGFLGLETTLSTLPSDLGVGVGVFVARRELQLQVQTRLLDRAATGPSATLGWPASTCMGGVGIGHKLVIATGRGDVDSGDVDEAVVGSFSVVSAQLHIVAVCRCR